MIAKRPTVIFVLPNLQPGGAVTSVWLFCQTLITAGFSVSALILGSRSEYAFAKFANAGIAIAERADLAEADLVVLCFWNTPAVHAFIREPHPPLRVALRPCVEGNLQPHVITREVADFADVVWASATSTLDNPNIARLPCRTLHFPRNFADFRRTSTGNPSEFVSGYLGTVDFVKLHRDYVSMSAAAGMDMVFELWGAGGAKAAIKKEAKSIGRENDFRVMGATDKPIDALQRFDVFGYPLCPDSYSANDATLQEAMAMGLPCVVIDHPGNRDLVRDGETALVASSPEAYSKALSALRQDPELRAQVGARAASSIRKFHADRSSGDMLGAVSDALAMPKRVRNAAGLVLNGADLFVSSLGDKTNAFSRNLHALRQEVGGQSEQDETEIASSSPGLCNAGAGGLFDYRAGFPDDPFLRYWTALVFARMGRSAVALAELHAARRLGLAPSIANERYANLLAIMQSGGTPVQPPRHDNIDLP